MRPHSRLIVIALLALVWTGVASAESPESLAPDALAAIAELELDSAFEQATRPGDSARTPQLAGPTTMACKGELAREADETCTVRTDRLMAAMPAALAPH